MFQKNPLAPSYRGEEFMNFIVWKFDANGKLIIYLASFDLIILNILHQTMFYAA
jgi:hypothetical protein